MLHPSASPLFRISDAWRFASPRATPRRPSGPAGLPARKDPRSDLRERTVCAREGRFRGGAPAPQLFRSSCAGRPAGIRNLLLNKVLSRSRVFRGGAKWAFRLHGECFAGAFPRNSARPFQVGRTTDRFWEKGIVTALPAYAVTASSAHLNQNVVFGYPIRHTKCCGNSVEISRSPAISVSDFISASPSITVR